MDLNERKIVVDLETLSTHSNACIVSIGAVLIENLEIVDREKNHLLEAMQLIVKTGVGPKKQIPSSGCSIKWK